LVDENACIGLIGIQSSLLENNTNVSQSSICRVLKRFHYTLKRVSVIPERRNSSKNTQIRYDYANRFFQILETIDDNNFVFVDEVGFCVTMRSRHWYSKRGTSAVITFPRLRSRNISICVSMTKNDVLHHEINLRAYNNKEFIAYVTNLMEIITLKNMENVVIVMNNVAFHKIVSVQEVIEAAGCTLLFLSPYSPFLNPIENCFSKWKYYLRYSAPANEVDLLNRIAEGWSKITGSD